jgi:peptide/nickel transport system permease protein
MSEPRGHGGAVAAPEGARGRWRRRPWSHRATRSPITVLSLAMLAVTVVLALLGPSLMPRDPLAVDLDSAFSPPSARFWLGTDDMGRDLLSRCLYGIRLSLWGAIIVAGGAAVVGLVVGGVAGHAGGRLDNVLMRITDMFLAFPALVLALAIAAALGPGLNNAVLAVAVVWWPWYARLVRAQALGIMATPYVEAARGLGVGPLRLLVRHVLPGTIPPVLVLASMDLGNVILATAGLNFIGLGAKPPTPELGAMISQGQRYLLDYWWVPTAPGLIILFMALGMNLLGDALRDLMDPQLYRGR